MFLLTRALELLLVVFLASIRDQYVRRSHWDIGANAPDLLLDVLWVLGYSIYVFRTEIIGFIVYGSFLRQTDFVNKSGVLVIKFLLNLYWQNFFGSWRFIEGGNSGIIVWVLLGTWLLLIGVFRWFSNAWYYPIAWCSLALLNHLIVLSVILGSSFISNWRLFSCLCPLFPFYWFSKFSKNSINGCFLFINSYNFNFGSIISIWKICCNLVFILRNMIWNSISVSWFFFTFNEIHIDLLVFLDFVHNVFVFRIFRIAKILLFRYVISYHFFNDL